MKQVIFTAKIIALILLQALVLTQVDLAVAQPVEDMPHGMARGVKLVVCGDGGAIKLCGIDEAGWSGGSLGIFAVAEIPVRTFVRVQNAGTGAAVLNNSLSIGKIMFADPLGRMAAPQGNHSSERVVGNKTGPPQAGVILWSMRG